MIKYSNCDQDYFAIIGMFINENDKLCLSKYNNCGFKFALSNYQRDNTSLKVIT